MSEPTSTISSCCIKTFCNEEILMQLQNLSRAGQKLLLFSLSRLSHPGNTYIDRSVRITFSDYCSLIQHPYNDQISHGLVRKAFYDIKYNCEKIINSDSVYSELSKEVIIVFKHGFIDTLTTSDHVALPANLFISSKRDKMPNIPLALDIYSKSKKTKNRTKTVSISVRDIIHILGGKFNDYSNPPKNWRTVYVKRISSTFMTFKHTGLIKSYCFNLDGKTGFDLYNCNDDPHDGTDITNSIIQNVANDLTYEMMTKYYRIYMDVSVVITI